MAKRVSSDEKITKIVNFFKSKPDFYCIKELEKKIPKECGISSMQLADFLKAVVDENLVNCEKCGGSNMYWAFQNQERHFRSCEIEKTQLGIESYSQENRRKRRHLAGIEQERQSSPERDALLAEYARLKERVAEIEKLRWQLENCSMAEYCRLEAEAAAIKEGINKTTDDIYTLQGYVCGKFNFDKKDFNSNFEVKEDMDYVD